MSLDQPSNEGPQDAAPSGEMSGQWIRDQLRNVAEPSETNPPNPTFVSDDRGSASNFESRPGDDDSFGPIVANLARNISEAVTKPIEDLERRRAAERDHIGRAVREQAERVDAIFAALRRLEEAGERLAETVNRQEGAIREQTTQSAARVDALQHDLSRERESFSESVGALRGELEGFAGRLSNSERNIEEQKAAIARLEALEQRRGEAITEVGRLVGSLQGALQAVSGQQAQGD